MMIKHRILVKHYYQDPNSPTIQNIVIDADYATAYALFMALLEAHLDFTIEIEKEQTP